MRLRNIYSKDILEKKIKEENFKRINLSFYRYITIENTLSFRNDLYKALESIHVLGRIYIANEGINAQFNVPEHHIEKLKEIIDSFPELKNMYLNYGIEHQNESFLKLIIKCKKKIVADGLDDSKFNTLDKGNYLTAKEFNKAIEDENTIVVDLRNHYETEVGHFEKAICPDTDTFQEELKLVPELLKDKKDKKILLYCTGGIRCEKSSAYLKHLGFKDVNQLKGGIITYFKEVIEEGLPSKFKGKNFVFDQRRGEKISSEIISECHQCGAKCDIHTNCANDDCHLLFLQCEECKIKFENCCSNKCNEIIHLPIEEQKRIRKGKSKPIGVQHYRHRKEFGFLQ